MKEHLDKLLDKFISQDITKSERKQLASAVSSMSDEELGAALSELWDNYKGSMPAGDFDAIAGKLMITPVRSRRLNWRRIAEIAAAAIVIPILVSSLIFYYNRSQSLGEFISQDVQISVSSGEKANVVLPDGTRLFLNYATTLSYSINFGLDKREVRLSGEAFFDVAKDTGKPFVVNTEYIALEVLGTKFNVNAYEEQSFVEATLVEGKLKVSVTDPAAEKQISSILDPNQKATYYIEHRIMEVVDTNTYFETAWTRGDLVFRSVKVPDLMHKLEQYYGVAIELTDDKYSSDLFSGSFREESVYNVLKKLQLHYNFKYETINDVIYVKFR